MPIAAKEEVSSWSDMNEDSTNSYEHTNHMRSATWGYYTYFMYMFAFKTYWTC